ncbi:aldehyde dehydrogenase family protein [Nocardioides humi]|uniref:Aldehyde dehydrogenase family protein n=1 Tax=Nocardioides humi TaxID=449461 RepID=A0ABN2AG38_9ACTN|nr:aldehyde dehydrogenase family protein [Nocardioides humi]
MLSMTIDGKPVDTIDAFDVVNPATGQVEAQAPECAPEQLDRAMASAQTAFGEWRRDDDARRTAMHALADAVDARQGELTELLVQETGKPLGVAAGEVASAAPWIRYYADLEWPRRVVQDDPSALIEVEHRPLGVVAAITPWNGPVGMWSWKIAPALRGGNTVVLKPSPFTPLATLLLGEIGAEVLPPGVINVVTGGDELGKAMTAHPTPRKVSFTGSIGAGRSVAVNAAQDLKRVTLELGGNDAAIVLDDADLERTVGTLFAFSMFNCGQICCIPKRIFVPSGRYEEFVEAFGVAARSLVVGDPMDPATGMGPLTTRPQYERVSALVDDAISSGARVVAGGKALDGDGYFFGATVLADVAEGVRIVDEEQFGPAVPLLRYDTVEEAVQRANATCYGLSGSVWSADEDRARGIAGQLECGTAWVNCHALLPSHAPFSGAKHSGLGVANGEDGLRSFTEQQVVHTARA